MAGPQEAQLLDSGDTTTDQAPLLHPLKRTDLGLFALDVYAEEVVQRKQQQMQQQQQQG